MSFHGVQAAIPTAAILTTAIPTNASEKAQLTLTLTITITLTLALTLTLTLTLTLSLALTLTLILTLTHCITYLEMLE